jgi:hypothetical protein
MQCVLFLISLLFVGGTPAFGQAANAQNASHSGFAAVLRGDNLIVVGGLLQFEGNARAVTANYSVNMHTGEAASISTDVIFSNWNAAALLGGVVYVSGGMSLISREVGRSGVYSTGFSDAFAAYDIANDTWRRLPDMPTTAIGHCSFANGLNIYVVGGQQERSMRPFRSPYVTATRILQFSIPDNRWSWMDAPAGVLSRFAACTRRGDEYFLMGGYREGPATKEVWVWNFITNTWSRGPDLPNAVSGATATLLDEAIYLAGGSVYSDQSGTPTLVDDRRVWRLRNGAEEWEAVGELTQQRTGHAMTSWNDGIFLIGGVARRRPPGLWIERIN